MAARAINATMGKAEWAMLILLSVLWGGSFFFAEVALAVLSPLTIVTLRVAIAAAAIWLFVLVAGFPVPRAPGVWLAFVVLGIINNAIPFTLIVWGQSGISSSLAAILNAATPVFSVVVAGIFLKDEPITLPKTVGVMLGFAGVAILVGPSAVAGSEGDLVYQLAVLGGGLAYAFAAVYARRFAAMDIHPVVIAAAQLLVSTVVMLLVLFSVEDPLVQPNPALGIWLAILGLAVMSTAVAYVLYFKVLERAGATNILLVTLLIPVTAILLGSLLLGEQLQWRHFAGMAIIALGLSVIDGRLWGRGASRSIARS